MVLKRSSSSAGWKKIELHGTQTSGLGHSRGAIWKKIKLHGTQTVVWSAANRVAIWKEIELQGSQTSY